MADPLSTATRATKRNLLIASVLAISANAFNISIDKIPLAGLSVNFDDRLFAFLLVLTLVYFLSTFVLYYTIDIKNLEATKHQTASEKSYTEKLQKFSSIYAERIATRLRKRILPEHDLSTESDMYGNRYTVETFKEHTYVVAKITTDALGIRKFTDVRRTEAPTLYLSLDKQVDVWVDQYPVAWPWFRRKHRLWLYGNRAMYITRNFFFDGMLPIALGIFALIAILGHIDLHWIQRFLPSFKVLS